MPNGDEKKLFQLPPFPTQFSEADRERLRELEEQKQVMQTIYQQKYTPAAWEKLPAWERTLRQAAGIVPAPSLMRGVIPWEEYEYGFTPEQARKYRFEVEEEFQELLRRKRVTGKLADIQTDLLILALSGTTVTTASDLRSQFPELGTDFNEEELTYVTAFAQSLVGASPEDILTGKAWGYGVEVPITEEDMEEMLRAGIEPRYILSTLSFSRDIADIKSMFMEAFRPEVVGDEAEISEEFRQKLLDYFQRRNVELGITPEPGESLEDTIKRAHEVIAKAEGKTVVLTDTETGAVIDVQRDEGNNLWSGDERVGFYNPETGKVEALPEDEQLALDTMPPNSVPFSIKTEDDEELYLIYKPSDRTLWDGMGNQLGSIDENGEFIPVEPTFWQKSLNATFVGLAAALLPFTWTGMGLHRMFVGEPFTEEQLDLRVEWSEEVKALLARYRNKEITRDEYDDLAEALAAKYAALGGQPSELEIAQKLSADFEDLPWWQKLLWESPAWVALGKVGLTATGIRASLAPLASRGGVTGITTQTVRVGLVPLAGYEKLLGLGLKYAIAVPIKVVITGVPKATNAAFESALGGRIGYWLALQGSRGEHANKIVRLFLEKNHAWLHRRAQEAIRKRMTQKMTHQQATNAAADDVFSEAKPLLLEVAKSVTGKELVPVVSENLIPAIYLATREASPAVISSLAKVAESIINQGLKPSQVSADYLVSFLPKGVTLEKTSSVIAQLKSLDFTEEAIQAMTPNEAWANLFKKVMPPPDIPPPTVPGEEFVRKPVKRPTTAETKALRTELAGVEEDIIIFTSSHAVAEGKADALERAKAPEAAEAKESVADLGRRLDDLTKRKGYLEARLAGLVELPAREAYLPGMPMPLDLQEQFLEFFGKGEPGLSSQKEGLVYRNPEGEPVAGVQLNALPDGRVQIDTVVNQAKGLLKGKATAALMKELKGMDVVMPDISEMSPEAVAIYKKLGFAVPEEIPQGETIIGKKKAAAITPAPSFRPETLDAKPSLSSWEAEQASIKAGLEANPDIAGTIKPPIDFDSLPDHSVRLAPGGFAAIKRDVFDMEYVFQFYQEKLGKPFLSIFRRMRLKRGIMSKIEQEIVGERIGKDARFNRIRNSEESLRRVEDVISSKNPALKVVRPENVTEEEDALADMIAQIFEEYEPKARFLKFEREYGTLEHMKKVFADAPEDELVEAIRLYEAGEEDVFWTYIKGRTWGLIENGYTPWMVSKPSLFPRIISLGTTRGGARFMRRTGVTFPEGMERNLLQRLATYIRQVESYWHLRPELKVLDELCSDSAVKLKNPGELFDVMESFVSELQGIPSENSLPVRIIYRIYRQAMGTIFHTMPWLSFRNIHQPLAFFPDRTRLAKILVKPISTALRAKNRIFYDTNVSQMRGIRMDWLFTGSKPLFNIPPFSTGMRLGDRLSMYAHSDNVPRSVSNSAAVDKAAEAIAQFRKDKDIKKLIKNSGAIHLRPIEQDYFKTLLVQEKVNWGSPGIRDLTGDEAAAMYVGQRVTDITHFLYERAFRAKMEHGTTGRLLFSLFVFPRSYFQRIYNQVTKLIAKESTWAERRAGFKDIALLIIIGSLISEWLRKITGKTRRAYNPFDIIRWDLGGLALGAAEDFINFTVDLIEAFDPTAEQEVKDRALSRLPRGATRLGDTLMPWYKLTIDSFEAATDTRNIDLHFLRQVEGKLNEEYTPTELEEIERTFVEKVFVKALMSGEVTEPDVYEAALEELQESQGRLGEMDAEGRFYTLASFGSDVRRLTRTLPDDMITEDYGFSELVIEYMEAQALWDELYKLPSTPAKIRQDYRLEHPELEVALLFWGKYSRSVYREGTPEAEEFLNTLRTLFDYFSIDRRMHPRFAEWGLPVKEVE